MTIEVCNEVNVKKGQCLRPLHHEGRHFWRSDMEDFIVVLDSGVEVTREVR